MNARRFVTAAVVSGLGVVAVAAAGLGVRALLERPAVARAVTRSAGFLEPGPLADVHRDLDGTGRCTNCHDAASPIDDSKCLACHSEIGDRARDHAGYHGIEFTGQCAECHRDHRGSLIDFDRASFNHRRALFALEGKHADVACEKCHERESPRSPRVPKRMTWIGVPHAECTACHDDPHHGSLTDAKHECTSCHDQTAWVARDLTFRHDRDTDFPLVGAHATLACEKCHVPPPTGAGRLADAAFVGTARTCAGCHEDPHRGALSANGRDCTACHDQTTWNGRDLSFRHDRDTTFPLRGAHADVACEKCHVPPAAGKLAAAEFVSVSTSCASCHADPHAGQFGAERCDACHRESGFRGRDLTFRHEDVASFPLTGAHAAVECAKCHKSAAADVAPSGPTGAADVARVVYRGTPTDCASCHTDPHAGSLAPKSCTACHETAAWTGAALRFDHARDARFALDAVHADLSCVKCHATKAYRPTPTECAACHTTEANDLAGRVTIGGREVEWTPSPHAGVIECRQCHDTTRSAETAEDLAEKCAACHNPRYAKLFADQRATIVALVAEARAGLATDRSDAADRTRQELDAVHRVAAHDHAAAEERVRAILNAARR